MMVFASFVAVAPRYYALVSFGGAVNQSYAFPLMVRGMKIFRESPPVLVTPWYISKALTESFMTSSVFVTQSVLSRAPALVSGYA